MPRQQSEQSEAAVTLDRPVPTSDRPSEQGGQGVFTATAGGGCRSRKWSAGWKAASLGRRQAPCLNGVRQRHNPGS